MKWCRWTYSGHIRVGIPRNPSIHQLMCSQVTYVLVSMLCSQRTSYFRGPADRQNIRRILINGGFSLFFCLFSIHQIRTPLRQLLALFHWFKPSKMTNVHVACSNPCHRPNAVSGTFQLCIMFTLLVKITSGKSSAYFCNFTIACDVKMTMSQACCCCCCSVEGWFGYSTGEVHGHAWVNLMQREWRHMSAGLGHVTNDVTAARRH